MPAIFTTRALRLSKREWNTTLVKPGHKEDRILLCFLCLLVWLFKLTFEAILVVACAHQCFKSFPHFFRNLLRNLISQSWIEFNSLQIANHDTNYVSGG